MKFNRVYKTPFEIIGKNVWSVDKKTTEMTMAFDFVGKFKDSTILRSNIVKALNSEKVKLYKFVPTKLVNKEDSFIQYNGKNFISIRGWGHLTGYLKINETKAAKMQDDFADWIIKTIKDNNVT